jgi:hypothetical protein
MALTSEVLASLTLVYFRLFQVTVSMTTHIPTGLQPNITKHILEVTAKFRVKTQQRIFEPSNRSLKRNGIISINLTSYFRQDFEIV